MTRPSLQRLVDLLDEVCPEPAAEVEAVARAVERHADLTRRKVTRELRDLSTAMHQTEVGLDAVLREVER